MSPFHLVLASHVAVVLLGSAFLLRYFSKSVVVDNGDGNHATVLAKHLVAVLVWFGAELVAITAITGPIGLSGFGFIHLVYLDLFVCLPAISVGLLVAHYTRPIKLRLSLGANSLASGPILLAIVGYQITYVEPFALEVTHTTISLGPGSKPKAPLRIGLLADLQAAKITDYERNAVALLMAEEPDIILIAGDVIHQPNEVKYLEVLPDFRELLATLHAPAGVYFVQGNADPPGIGALLFKGTDIIGLRDRIVSIPFGEDTITLGGLSLAHHKYPKGQEVMGTLAAMPATGDIRLLLTHVPDPILYLPEDCAIDLVLAGHTHGGQIQIPFFGPPITLSNVPRHIAAGGLNEHKGNLIYVSRGVGVERAQAPRMRFLARPEISIITLE